LLRGQKVLLSTDLAVLYGVPVRSLIQAVKRNKVRFPPDFLFQLDTDELKILKSQSVISSWGGARRAAPYAFTEHGVAMLSSILRSSRAVQVNIAIMRTFVHLRSMLATHEDLRRKISEMEKRYDSRFRAVFATLQEMLAVQTRPKRRIGFHAAVTPRSRDSSTTTH
jgi:ORF6N domain